MVSQNILSSKYYKPNKNKESKICIGLQRKTDETKYIGLQFYRKHLPHVLVMKLFRGTFNAKNTHGFQLQQLTCS